MSEEYTDCGRHLKGKSLKASATSLFFPILPISAQKGAFRVILEEQFLSEEGTGIVHSAPAFGEVDFYACQREGIELVCPVDNNGRFTEEVPEYAGLFVKDADKEIIKRLKERGQSSIMAHAITDILLLAFRHSSDL